MTFDFKKYQSLNGAEIIELIKGCTPEALNTDIQNYCSMSARRELPSEALTILWAIYQRLTEATQPVWTAYPLVAISAQFTQRGCPWLAKYFAMLALCAEAPTNNGQLSKTHTSYRYLVGNYAMSEQEIQAYAKAALSCFNELNTKDKIFPERILASLDEDWKTGVPSINEYGLYFANGPLIKYTLTEIESIKDQLAKNRESMKDGKVSPSTQDATTKKQGDLLEFLGRYLMSCMPGARVNNNSVWQEGTGTDYDVVCSLDGFQVDFRTEFGRYFICECKAWSTATDFEVIAKFSRVLDSVRSKFGILFSLNGLTGEGQGTESEREQLNIYRDRGIVIISLDKTDLLAVAEGTNFINLIRSKYDEIRLFRRKAKKDSKPKQKSKARAKKDK